MAVSYKKLWKLLIDRDLKKKDLETMARVSHYTMNKLTHGDNVTTDVLGRICNALGAHWTTLWSLWMSRLASTVLKFSRAHIRREGAPS